MPVILACNTPYALLLFFLFLISGSPSSLLASFALHSALLTTLIIPRPYPHLACYPIVCNTSTPCSCASIFFFQPPFASSPLLLPPHYNSDNSLLANIQYNASTPCSYTSHLIYLLLLLLSLQIFPSFSIPPTQTLQYHLYFSSFLPIFTTHPRLFL